MPQIPYLIFPEFKDQLSASSVKNRLGFIESIIGFSKGKSLSRDEINRITDRLGTRIRGTRLFPGGSSVLFAWSFPFDRIGSIIMKPYYNREISALLIHYFTFQDFILDFQGLQFQLSGKEIQVTVPEVVGLAKIETLSRLYPVLITKEAPGESIQTHPPLIKAISNVARGLAQKGIICDPYPSNWKVSFSNDQGVIQYVDLLSSNRLKNVHDRIAELLQSLG
ncbi:MAG: hypothetical protein ACXADY_08985 [Candidatus Hodarchaeales archaeon]|jgi:hypothetical protein